VLREQRFYLIGYCHDAGEVRTFRIGRFRRVEITDKPFQPDVTRYVKEEGLFVRPKMTDLPDGNLLFEVTINHEREFLNWVMQYGPPAEILEPASAREQFREQLESGWSCIRMI
jgi:predicted DNA-binding transcriptional regulator YafY